MVEAKKILTCIDILGRSSKSKISVVEMLHNSDPVNSYKNPIQVSSDSQAAHMP